MNDRKFFFFDIDGTLVPEDGGTYIPENTRQALGELKSRGHFMALATGRAQCMAVGRMKDLGFDSMVSDGGYGVTLNGKLLGIEPIDRELCIQLAEECEEAGFAWGCSTKNEPLRLTRSQRFCDETNDSYQKARLVPDLDLEKEPVILKMFVSLPPGQEKLLPALSKLPWMRYGKMPYIFVEPQDKAKGIRIIMKELGCKDSDVVVFGDELNDLSMFLPEWTCIAMGNAREEVKARADFVTRNCDDDGVGYALRYFGWI
jgi:Cof subfamily protein (haloacid dehalogenase superfamily)